MFEVECVRSYPGMVPIQGHNSLWVKPFLSQDCLVIPLSHLVGLLSEKCVLWGQAN